MLAWSQDEVANAPKTGIVVEISFDSGSTWDTRLASVCNDDKRCAIMLTDTDLREIAPLDDPSDNFVRAYIEGRLRVRVTAAIAGDDATYGVAVDRDEDAWPLDWWEALDRAEKFRRSLRNESTSELISTYDLDYLANRDDTAALDGMAARALGECAVRRASGTVVLPYLMDPESTDSRAYRIGDEVLGIETELDDTRLSLDRVRQDSRTAPRIVGMRWAWSAEPGEASTTLLLEDDRVDPARGGGPEPGGLAGDPG